MSSRSKYTPDNNNVRATTNANNVNIDKKFLIDADLVSEFTADGLLTKNGQILQKAIHKIQNDEDLDYDEFQIQ